MYVVSAFTKAQGLVIPWWLRREWDWVQGRFHLIQLRVSHIFREGNSVADLLAGFRGYDKFI
ncbi:hypothetical protein ACS0TY_035482 [Phlomoides rotata]